MNSIRIVCTHDAVKIAETLARLLGAEGDDVRITFGRQSLEALPAACEASEAVLLIWSYDAPNAHYMRQWANMIPPERVVEIARAPGWPRTQRRAPVIDFSTWRGERGGRAWHALSERLRAVHRFINPQPEPMRKPAIAVGIAGAVAAGVALMIGGDAPGDIKEHAFDDEKVTLALIDSAGMGGPMSAFEPASLNDPAETASSLSVRGFASEQLPELQPGEISDVAAYEPQQVREATLLERISALNPIAYGER